MAYTKTILCLAASTREGGYCVAGKECNPDGTSPGSWVRPISKGTHAIPESCLSLHDGSRLQLGNIITVQLDKHAPNLHQQENHEITDTKWVKCGSITKLDQLNAFLDHPDSIWLAGSSSTFRGENDRVASVAEIENSLYLIYVTNLVLSENREEYDGNSKLVLRAKFSYNGTSYILKVRDPDITDYFHRNHKLGDWDIENAILCLSLAENKFHGYYYKILASIPSLYIKQ